MQKLSVIIIAAGLLLLAPAGHARKKKALDYPPFPAEEYALYVAGGGASITGQAFLRTQGGEVRTAAGFQVTLDPITRYSRVWWEERGSRWNTKREEPPEPGFGAARRVTRADAEGRFAFKGLAPGAYFLRTVVVWEAPGGTQGGLLVTEVTLGPGEALEVLLTEVTGRGNPNIWEISNDLTGGR